MGSRGSVIPFFCNIANGVPTPITSPEMTRFMIDLGQAVDLVNSAFAEAVGGEIFVKKIPSMRVIDIAKAIRPFEPIEVIGIRPGEKLHEQMVGASDCLRTIDTSDFYVIIPELASRYEAYIERFGDQFVEKDFIYRSDLNTVWMSISELKTWLDGNRGKWL